MYNIQTFYGWQTQYKCVMSTHKIFYEYTQMCPHSTTKYTMNIPWIIPSHTKYTMNIPQIIYIRPRNTQRTFRELSHHTQNTQWTFRKLSTSPTKYTANTPLGVGADSSRPYLPSINSVSVCHHFMGVYIYAGTTNRSLQLLTDCDNACEHSANYLHRPRNTQRTHR